MTYKDIFFFYRQTHKKHILENDTLNLTQKHTWSIQEAPKGTKRKYKTSPQLAPSLSKKLSKGRGPSFTTDLVHNQRLHTKEFFNL